ncbi:uncharacterized protein HaLaN_00594, partial [Haematococcus lacustris]
METSLHYGLAEKQLSFKLREQITAAPGVELKGNGMFNTITGKLGYTGTLKACARLGADDKDSGSSPLTIGLGAFAAAQDTKAPPAPQLHLSVKKGLSVFDGPRTVITGKAFANYDPMVAKVTARKAVIKLSHKWMGFTQRQDLKLSVGMDVDWPLTAKEPVVVGHL